ncbi:MAG: hypothetical protein ABR501_03295 [Pyrinomonadaceae bacterium]
MTETTESGRNVVNELCDALRYLGDASYAILPRDMAHSLGDLNKAFLSTVRTLIDKDIEWVEARVAGGDRVREEWQRKWNRERTEAAPDPIN